MCDRDGSIVEDEGKEKERERWRISFCVIEEYRQEETKLRVASHPRLSPLTYKH
jgi:hypothetical protein